MAAPSKPFTVIPDTKIDADSPATEEIFTFDRDNDIHLDERIGIPANAGARQTNHAHLGPGVDGTAIIGVGNTSIPWLADPVTLVSGGNATSFTDVDVSASIVPEAADMDVEWFDDSTSTLIDKTTAARLNDASGTGVVMDDSADFLYIGANETFIKILVDLVAAAGASGALTVEFFNGTAFAAVSGLTDGTASGGNTFKVNGNITFTLPTTWATGAQAVQAGLDSSLFYVRLSFANSATGPNIDQAAPKPFTAKLVFLQCKIVASGNLRVDLAVRRNGSSSVTPNVPQLRRKDATATAPEMHGMLFVGLDAGEIFEFKTIQSGNAITIVMVGFIR